MEGRQLNEWLQFAQVIAPLTLGVFAFFLGGLNERKRDERALEREDVARKDLRRAAVESERHAFQQETLLSLQVSLIAVARIGTRTLLADQETIRETGKFGMLPEEIGGVESMETMRNFNLLANRILDDSLRGDLLGFSSVVSKVSLPPGNWESLTQAQAEAVVAEFNSELGSAVSRAQEALGVALRLELARTVP